jgi:hypothetical protein
MYQNRFILCSAAAVLATAVACSKSSPNPASPTSTQEASGTAAADGSTLKVPAPTPVSPVNGAQPDQLVLTANKVTGKFDSSLNPSYEFRVKTSGGSVVSSCTAVMPPGSGNTVSHAPTCTLDLDTPHTWSVRAVFGGAVGPWSPDTSFRSPLGGYITGSEIYDPLYNGKTIGTIRGPVTFGPNGATLVAQTSHIRYHLPVTLQEGELSVMILGADEGADGDKSKVFSMQEGPDENDVTDDDYRMTAELRGNRYPNPGAVTFRIITGDADDHGSIFDGARVQLNFNSTRWYFWRFAWQTGRATLTVRQDGPNGAVIYNSSRGTGGHPYRPSQHLVYLGGPVGRNGPIDATLPGGTYKNLWVSSRPRPAFPGE